MKNKGLIVAFSCACIFVVALVATIIVLASGTQNVGSNVSLIYVASEIGGSVSATYRVGNDTAKDMTTSSGAKIVSFGSDQPTTLSLLSPNEAINLLYGEDVILTYTFTSAVEEYYAHMSYSDTDTPYTNLVFSYKKESDLSYATNTSKLITVPRLGSTTFSVKISIDKAYLNASLKGTIDWALTKEEPIIVEEKVNLNIANNAGSSIKNNTFSYQARKVDGKKQFKIVGATPVIDSTSTSGHINGYYDRTTLASTGKVSSIDDLTNSSGAEFFYFCTNSAVIGSTGYTDPGEIYYTSTADSTLESWYDLPTSATQLYACFMKPNYTSEVVYSGSDTQIVISNKVVNIPYKAFYNKSSITDVVIPQSVKKIMGYREGLVFYGAFSGCSNLKKVFIPNSVTSIGEYAFYKCSGLTSITTPDNVTSIGNSAFYYCSGLTSITIPDSVTSIGDSAFYRCSSLTSIKIPNSVTSIGNYVFSNCSSLTSVTIPNGVTNIGSGAFNGCSGLTSITIPDSVTSIGKKAFDGCDNLTYNEKDNIKYLGNSTNPYVVVCGVTDKTKTTYAIDNNAKIIWYNAFDNCRGLTSITIPDNVTSIEDYAFYNCSGLTSITIPDSVTSIGEYAFYVCSGLTNITIPDSVTSIGEYAFYVCSGLTNITILDGVTSIGDWAFSSCSALTSITIPDSVTSIGSGAFSGCSGLTNITIGNSVTSIEYCAFRSCSGLTSITIPNSVTSIEENAFQSCIGLTSITIPNSVTSIGNFAFSYCSSLTSITIPDSVTGIGKNAFSSCSKLTSVTFADTSKTWTANSQTISVTNPAQNATYLTNTYLNYNWTKNS